MPDPAAAPSRPPEELTEQLREAQEVLAAIRRGEVDALLVGEPGREAVYTLTSAERPYRVMVEQMNQGAATLAPGGHVLYANRRLAELLDVPLERLIGSDFAAWAEVAEEPARLLGPGGGEMELRLRRSDGATVPVHVSVAELIESGERRFCAVIADLTQQRTHERLRESEERLREMDQRKDEFLAMLGHELRNPLAPITHAADILRHELSPSSPRVDWALDVIGRQLRHLGRMVDDLLDIARITRGAVELRRGHVCLQEVVGGAVEVVRPHLEDKKHELEREVPKRRLWVDGDAARLVQVVGNLLHNACKYTPPGGHIRIALERDGDQALIAITDDGAGMPADLVPRVFDTFARGEVSLDRPEPGLGLGLAVARRIVEGHGGGVAASSDGPGHGSRFEVRLPLTTAPAEAAGDGEDDRPEPARPRRVLVVDDNRDSADALALLLSQRGFEAQTAFDGDGALSLLEAFRPEVALLDIGLPGMDGYELARRLRERLGPELVLVAVTGYGRRDDRERALAAGFDQHCTKPVEIDEIEELVRAD